MTCGIYKLTFTSGHIYIGQSINIEQRWNQHSDKFRKGTAARPMQAAFNSAGFPNAEILKVCHEDHLDMMESMYINSYCITHKPKMLNTSIPKDYTSKQIDFVYNHEYYLDKSIVELMSIAETSKRNMSSMQETLDDLEDRGVVLPVDTKHLVRENISLKDQYNKLIKVNQLLSVEANKTWLQKLFS